MDDTPQGDPEHWFHLLGAHYLEAQCLYHLNQAGVVSLLAEGPCDANEVAARLGLNARVVQSLLRFVAAVDGVIEMPDEQHFALTPFGRKVLARFGRVEQDGAARYNLFDVRVGAYGNVWASMDRLLKDDNASEEIARNGEQAEEGLYKLTVRLEPKLAELVAEHRARTVVELGVLTGLTQGLAARDSTLALKAVDRSPRALEKAARRARTANVHSIEWLQGDVFEPEGWLGKLDPTAPGIVFSVHFHEFVALSSEAPGRLVSSLVKMGKALPGWKVVLLEQPLLSLADRSHTAASVWLSGEAMMLIHHLLGDGRLLPTMEWKALMRRGGLEDIRVEPTGYLGFEALIGTFPRGVF